MSFTIVKNLEQIPSYPTLCELAQRNQVLVFGDEHSGSFSARGVQGDYHFNGEGIQGKFSGHGVRGEYSLSAGIATVSVIEKPFWLPESLLKRKIEDGLTSFVDSL